MNLSEYSRRPSCEVRIGRVVIGGGHPVAVQSMTNTDTNDTEASVAQIERIDRAGGKIVRLTAQGRREGENLARIVRRLRDEGFDTAVVADIHFLPEVAAIAAQYVDKVRINPGNYRTDRGELEELIARCRERGVALRIGVNHGSLAKRVFDQWGDTPQGMVVSAMEFLRVCKAHGFDQVVVSMKSSNTRVMVAAYRLLVAAMDAEDMHYPIHLGVTEAGRGIEGRIKSAVGIGALLCDGIGDTIRVSLTPSPGAPRTEEVVVAQEILQCMGLRSFTPMVTSCPGCGRTTSDLFQRLAAGTQDYLRSRMPEWRVSCPGVENMTGAVMGCVVNGPGESRQADIGISLPGSGESPVAPVYVRGEKVCALKGDDMQARFHAMIEEFVQTTYGASSRGQSDN